VPAVKCAAHSFVGTSGWIYDAWRNDFYDGVPQNDRLRSPRASAR
jgi:uncharacterized protein YecE (DUF72 family)